jgi:hypothetical protein
MKITAEEIKRRGGGAPVFGRVGLPLALLFLSVLAAPGQTPPQEAKKTGAGALRIFLECPACDIPFIRSQIPFVDFVRERGQARVYVIITAAETKGGEEYTLSFRGLEDFAGDDDLLRYKPAKTDPPDEVRKGLAHMLELGLMRYVGKTPLSSRISINFLGAVKPTAVVDKWNFWVFSLSLNSFLSGEQTYNNAMYFASFSANRVTPNLKIRLSLSAAYERDKFDYEGEVLRSASDSRNFQGLAVKSLDEHWSVGAYFSAASSTYSNIKLNLSPSPAVEYDLFPYSESTRRQLRFLYRLSFKSVSYLEETIYLKTHENLLQQSLSMTLELVQKWGTVSTSLEGANYLHDFSQNHLDLWGELSLRLFQGLDFNLHGGYSRIHDQLSLSRAGASYEDVLLRRKQLATTFDYYFSVGLSYTFGSLRSKVVNPRFGDGGGGVSIRISM